MAGNVEGPLTPQQAEIYRQEYRDGADLFQRALQEYSEADEIHKRQAFKSVMDQAMNVMNQTARQLKQPDLLQVNQKIATDYQAYQESGSPAAMAQLNQDLQKAKDAYP